MVKVLALAALAACGAEGQEYSNSYKGRTPPEIASEKGDWLNSTEALKLEKLRGKVVWLEFSFIN